MPKNADSSTEVAQVTSFPPVLLGYLTFLEVTCAIHLFSCETRETTLFCCACKRAERTTYSCVLAGLVEPSTGAVEVLSLSS